MLLPYLLSSFESNSFPVLLKKYLGVILICTINIILIGLLTASVIENNNDKGPVVFIFGYLLIVSGNLIIWGILSLLGTRFSKQMGICVTILSVLFVPLLVYMLNQ